jgi:cell fate regulator YaaT (PSP1 superfamily)
MDRPIAGESQELTRAVWAMTEELKSHRSEMGLLADEIRNLNGNVFSLNSDICDLDNTVGQIAQTCLDQNVRNIEGEVSSIRSELYALNGIKVVLDEIKMQNAKLCRIREAEEHIGAM